jgi:hypothetical protein
MVGWLALRAGACQTNESKGDILKANSVTPTATGSLYSFQFGDAHFAVDAKPGRSHRQVRPLGSQHPDRTGRRPGQLRVDILVEPAKRLELATSPRNRFSALRGQHRRRRALLSGATAAGLGLAVEKKFSADSKAGVVSAVYTIANRGSQARQVAPWEITRVAAGGLTFFPMGEGGPRKGPQDLLSPTVVNGVAWFAYDAAAITADQKLFADGKEGWIAHVDGDLLLVKSFADTPTSQAAPGEAEIELYANAGHTYVEVENQGAYVNLAPGATIAWTVRWMLRKLDLASTPAKVGSAPLLKLVRSLVK